MIIFYVSMFVRFSGIWEENIFKMVEEVPSKDKFNLLPLLTGHYFILPERPSLPNVGAQLSVQTLEVKLYFGE